jgi:hypothetical protein
MTLRQFLMLRYMVGNVYTIPQAILFRQRTFGALCKRHWVDYNAFTKRFFVTKAGVKALSAEKNHTMHRQKTAGLMEFGSSVFASNHVQMKRVQSEMRRTA